MKAVGQLHSVMMLTALALLISGCGDVLWHRDKDEGKRSMTSMSEEITLR